MSSCSIKTLPQDEVAQVIEHYLEGARSGQIERMRLAFHPDATMFGLLDDNQLAGPIQALFDWSEATGPASELVAEIEQIDIEGSIATVRISLQHWHGYRFTDMFTLLKMDGEWKIINKVFHQHLQPATTVD